MRFRLRTLLILLAVVPPVLAAYALLGAWFIRAVIPMGNFDLITGPYSPFR